MMAFNGYLIKIGSNDTFFNTFINYESYNSSKKVQDLDSTRDATGVLHRTALEHSSYVIELTLRPMNNIEVEQFMSVIRSSYTNVAERRLRLTFFVAEINDYVTEDVYLPDPKFTITMIRGNEVKYKETPIKFIGY